MELNVFANIRSIGLIAMSLDAGDSLDWARLTTAARISSSSRGVGARCVSARRDVRRWDAPPPA
jgi:hypothetical protein